VTTTPRLADITFESATGGGGGGGGGGARDGTGMAAGQDDVPRLLRVLAGNPVTFTTILGCFPTADATRLRQLHPAVAGVVAGLPWTDMDTAVVDVVRWRAAFPAAVGVKVSPVPTGGRLTAAALAALAGVTHLCLHNCDFVRDEFRLPPSLRVLEVSSCPHLTASFVHLTALTSLDCSGSQGVERGVDHLPVSLQELDVSSTPLPAGASLARLVHLRVLRAYRTRLDTATVSSLPPSLQELYCDMIAPGASFAHLPALHTLDASHTDIDDTSLTSMPPSLAFLNVRDCKFLTRAAVLPPLPALRLLDVSRTGVGDALVVSLPAGLAELRMVEGRGMTAHATVHHVRALQSLHSYGTDLAPGVLAACRARGCVVPAAGGQRRCVTSLAVLADGRLASGDEDGALQVWNEAAGEGEVGVVLRAGGVTRALAVLRDGHRLAARGMGRVDIWELGVVPPVRTASIRCILFSSTALVVLRDGCLATGGDLDNIMIVDVDAGAVVATLGGHTRRFGSVVVLAALPDGTLASGSEDRTVRLWDVGTRTCAGVLTGHIRCVTALAALPDGRLASGSQDGTLRVWDTRPAVAAAGSHAAATVPVVVFVHGLPAPGALVPLPDGRLACDGSGGAVYLLHVPPPAPYE